MYSHLSVFSFLASASSVRLSSHSEVVDTFLLSVFITVPLRVIKGQGCLWQTQHRWPQFCSEKVILSDHLNHSAQGFLCC